MLDSKSLTQLLNQEVAEELVAIARNEVHGSDEFLICELFGITLEELREVTSSELYKEVRTAIGAETAISATNRDASYDSLEEAALNHLMKVVKVNKDPELSIKIATMANRANRRVGVSSRTALDPDNGANVIPIKLSRRTVVAINQGNHMISTEEVMEFSKTIENPKFEELRGVLGIDGGITEAEEAGAGKNKKIKFNLNHGFGNSVDDFTAVDADELFEQITGGDY